MSTTNKDGSKPLTLDQTESACDWFDHNLQANTDDHGDLTEGGRVRDGEDAEEWQRLSERECDYTEII